MSRSDNKTSRNQKIAKFIMKKIYKFAFFPIVKKRLMENLKESGIGVP